MNTYYAIKDHMSQTWDASGKRLAVTVLSVPQTTVTAIRTTEKDGHQAIQVAFGKAKRITKPLKFQLKNDDLKPQHVKEISLENADEVKPKDNIDITEYFSIGDIVNTTSLTKGRGFTGVMKRWGFGGGPKTHGQSDRARAPGSIGQGTDPGRVHKGKKMAGRHGANVKTIKNLQILHIDSDNHTIMISGPIPGPKGTLVKLTKIRSGKVNLPSPKNQSPETI